MDLCSLVSLFSDSVSEIGGGTAPITGLTTVSFLMEFAIASVWIFFKVDQYSAGSTTPLGQGANKDEISVSVCFHNYVYNYFLIFLNEIRHFEV